MSTLGRTLRRWTYSEIQRLQVLYAAGKNRGQMCEALGMTDNQVRSRLQWENKLTNGIRSRKRGPKRIVPKVALKSSRDFVTAGPVPTPDTLYERERRLAAPKTLTGWLAGDPPIGFSALERRA